MVQGVSSKTVEKNRRECLFYWWNPSAGRALPGYVSDEQYIGCWIHLGVKQVWKNLEVKAAYENRHWERSKWHSVAPDCFSLCPFFLPPLSPPFSINDKISFVKSLVLKLMFCILVYLLPLFQALMLLFQLKGLVLEKGTLFSLWKLPSCSIGMDISNPGEEQLPMQKSGRSGMFLTLQASSTWSADTRKPTKQSRVHLNKWWCFLRKLLEPSRTFFFSQFVLQSHPCLLEHKVMHSLRCSSEMHRSKGGSCHLCDTRCYSSSTTENKGRSPQTSTFVYVISVVFSCSLLQVF